MYFCVNLIFSSLCQYVPHPRFDLFHGLFLGIFSCLSNIILWYLLCFEIIRITSYSIISDDEYMLNFLTSYILSHKIQEWWSFSLNPTEQIWWFPYIQWCCYGKLFYSSEKLFILTTCPSMVCKICLHISIGTVLKHILQYLFIYAKDEINNYGVILTYW